MKRSLRWFAALFTIATAAPMVTANQGTEQDALIAPNWLQQPMTLPDARHLAGRTGFGASPAELVELVGLSRHDAVERIANGIKKTADIPMPGWVDEPAPRFWKRQSLPREQQQAFDEQRDREIAQLRQWWVNNILQTSSPQTERLVMFWHDHFATSYDGVNRRSISIARQNQTFRRMGTGSYREFLKAMIRDPALLIYLDNQRNRKGRPNENLARELLELFTLGEGNYDEATVKEAARALTGYGVSDTRNQSFQLHGYKHDNDNKTLFGVTANHNGDSLVDLILEQPAAAEFLAAKFWSAFIADSEPDPAFIAELSNKFRQSDYDLFVLYKSVLRSQHFWDENNRLSLIKSPATLLLGTARTLDFPKRAWSQLASLQALLGMELFAPPNVSGWKEGAAFVAPGRLLNRQLAIQTLLESASSQTTDVNSMMANQTMMTEPSANTMQTSAPLQVRLAGHFFKGAPKFSVSLSNNDSGHSQQLWVSEQRELSVGYDTEIFGPMQNEDLLPWLTENYVPPAQVLSEATSVSIEFHNDAASKTGDRNLFVESVIVNDQKYDAENGVQVSGCVPKNKRYSGALYCAGTVSIELADETLPGKARAEPYSATDARVIWTNSKPLKDLVKANNGVGATHKLDAIIALENVQAPDRFFHTVSFHLTSRDQQSLEMKLNSFACWPDCIDLWPECAWHEALSGQKTLLFPLRRGDDEHIDCHYASLTTLQQGLINALWKSIPDIFDHVATVEPRERNVRNLKLWQERINSLNFAIDASEYVQHADSIAIDSNYELPAKKAQRLSDPLIEINSLTELEQSFNGTDLSLADLLIGGAELTQLPELQAGSDLPIARQLENIVSHPVYQVY